MKKYYAHSSARQAAVGGVSSFEKSVSISRRNKSDMAGKESGKIAGIDFNFMLCFKLFYLNSFRMIFSAEGQSCFDQSRQLQIGQKKVSATFVPRR